MIRGIPILFSSSRRRSGGGGGTLAFVQAKRNREFASGTNQITLDSSVTAGNLIAVGISWDSTSETLVSVTDSLGNAYTLVGNPTNSITGRMAMAYAPDCVGGSDTVIATFSGAIGSVICAQEISGANAVNPLDQSAFNAQINPGTGTDAVTSGSVTPGTSGQYIFGYSGESNNASMYMPGTGFTDAVGGTAGAGEYQVQTVAAPISATFTISAGFSVTIAGIMTFKA